MDTIEISRFLTAMTLTVHIISAAIGIGMLLMFTIAESLGIRRNDLQYMAMAKRWAKAYIITVAVGVVTGTITGLQLSLIWPTFMEMGGHAIALPLLMEIFAFFFEVIFLSIYLYIWNRFKSKRTHFLISIPVIIGGSFSAFFITPMNSFMDTPAGFELENGRMVNIQPIEAMFNPSFTVRSFHVITTAGMTTAFAIASIAAFKLLRSRQPKDTVYHKEALKISVIVGFFSTLLFMLTGDLSVEFLHEFQPEKLAAYGWHFDTSSHAKLLLFGMLDEKTQQVKGAIELPGLLSFLADNSIKTRVQGLNDFPRNLHPPMIVHHFSDLMVTAGILCFVISGVHALALMFKKLRNFSAHKWILYGILLTGPASMLAIGFGWFLTETGKQPWIVHSYMRVTETATQASGIALVTILFGILYTILMCTYAYILIRVFESRLAYGDINRLAEKQEGEIEKWFMYL